MAESISRVLDFEERKALGAFYTPEEVVRFLVSWGGQHAPEAVMDPSSGDGRFLAAARDLGVDRLVACDIDPAALEETLSRLADKGHKLEIHGKDFFLLEPGEIEPVDLVVGNPPFIRYQRFQGETRNRALRSALRVGARLTRLTSSWAPFVLHAMQFLRPGGNLSMVIPAEATQTQYGLTTLRALLGHFGEVRLLAFERNLFEEAQEETCLLLAADKGLSCREVRLVPLVSWHDLEGLSGAAVDELAPGVGIPFTGESPVRFAEAFLTPAERRAWTRAKRLESVHTLASLATVTNGYVTGANTFFHRLREEAEAQGYPRTWLFPVARSSKSLSSLFFRPQDVVDLERHGKAHHLVVPQHDLFDADGEALRRFAQEGERQGVPGRYKCRTRNPWWQVPGLVEADVLVAYMSGAYPRASVNQAGAFYPNTLHGLKLRDGIQTELLALSLYSTLSLLSIEIEGRSYGGGLLKMEPRELDRVLVALPDMHPATTAKLAQSVDAMLRSGRYGEAVEAVDEALLKDSLGLSSRFVERLRTARRRLLERRSGRARRQGRGPSS